MNSGLGMLEAGASQRHVEHQLGVSQSVVAKLWNRFQIRGNVIHRHGGDYQTITTQTEDRFIVKQARRHRCMSATALQNDIQNATANSNHSKQTV